MDERYRFNAELTLLACSLSVDAPRRSPLETEQTRNYLEVVFNPMMNLPEEELFLTQRLLKDKARELGLSRGATRRRGMSSR
jgi:hypothetical protein